MKHRTDQQKLFLGIEISHEHRLPMHIKAKLLHLIYSGASLVLQMLFDLVCPKPRILTDAPCRNQIRCNYLFTDGIRHQAPESCRLCLHDGSRHSFKA